MNLIQCTMLELPCELNSQEEFLEGRNSWEFLGIEFEAISIS